MKLLLTALLTALIVVLAPGAAHACGVPQPKALYETPDVQIYETGTNLRKGFYLKACHRASGKTRIVGYQYQGAHGYNDSAVLGVAGGRWVSTYGSGGGGESYGESDYTVADLVTGTYVTGSIEHEFEEVDAAPFAGGMLIVGPKGVVLHHLDGRRVTLSADTAATTAAVVGARAYWRDGAGVAQTATIELPAGDSPRAAPRARTIGRCKPRRGARLVLIDDGTVVTRTGADTWACARGRTRRLPAGAVDVQILSSGLVAYALPGVAGTLTLATGARAELPHAGSLTAIGSALATSGLAGLRLGDRLLSPEAGIEIAADDYNDAIFWLDPAGVARTAAL
jgi:hypothetical protein